MTKEQKEIIETINNIPAFLDGNKMSEEDSIKISIALGKAFQALEQIFDPISKKEAIKILNGLIVCNSRYSNICEALEMAIDALKQELKTGHWIDTKEDSTNARGQIIHEVVCSECNGIAYFRSTGDKYISANICPSCGTHMKDGD